MTSGMAHISGGIMAAYILFGIEAKHLLTAVIMTAPGTLMMAKMFVPETEVPETMGTVRAARSSGPTSTSSTRRAAAPAKACAGAERRRDADFVPRAGRAGQRHPRPRRTSSLQQIFGWVFAPVAWSMGVPWRDAPVDRQPARHAHGAERVRRVLAARPAQGKRSTRGRSRSPPSRCAGSRTSARSGSRSAASARWRRTRRHDLARLGLRAMLAGTFANFITATIAGFLL